LSGNANQHGQRDYGNQEAGGSTHKNKDASQSTAERAERNEETKMPYDQLLRAYEEEKKRAEGYLARIGYLQADYENLRNRSDRQITEAKKYANEALLCELLEIADELELALNNARSKNNSTEVNKAIIEGVEMTLKKLNKTFEKEGVCPIKCRHKPFDPSLHAAIGTVETSKFDEGTVMEEVRRGYVMKEKVIRPSLVKVAVNPQSKAPPHVDEEQPKINGDLNQTKDLKEEK